MADYISREAAIKAVQPKNAPAINKVLAEMLNRVPAADVQHVVKARWKKDNSYPGPGLMNLRCSVCGAFGGTWKDSTLPSMLYNFCPNCGAYMEGNENG